MGLFMDTHELGERDEESFLLAWSERKRDGISCLRHWVNASRITLLVEAPDRDSLQEQDRDALELTGLFAPASRWMEEQSVDTA